MERAGAFRLASLLSVGPQAGILALSTAPAALAPRVIDKIESAPLLQKQEGPQKHRLTRRQEADALEGPPTTALGADCWLWCNQVAGACPGFCGDAGACCKRDAKGDEAAEECGGIGCEGVCAVCSASAAALAFVSRILLPWAGRAE